MLVVLGGPEDPEAISGHTRREHRAGTGAERNPVLPHLTVLPALLRVVTATVPAHRAPLAPVHLNGIETEPPWTVSRWFLSEAVPYLAPTAAATATAATATRAQRPEREVGSGGAHRDIGALEDDEAIVVAGRGVSPVICQETEVTPFWPLTSCAGVVWPYAVVGPYWKA